MSDGRKNNGGHSTKGVAGRKPKADELKLIEQMDAVAVPEKIWKRLFEKAIDGDVQALKTWIQYRYGMPNQKMDVTTKGESFNYTPEERAKRLRELIKKI